VTGCGKDGGRRASRLISIATGGSGGVYYPYGARNREDPRRQAPRCPPRLRSPATAEVSAASVDNLKLIRDARADIAFTPADSLADAVAGAPRRRRAGAGGKPRRPLLELHALHLTRIVWYPARGGPPRPAEAYCDLSVHASPWADAAGLAITAVVLFLHFWRASRQVRRAFRSKPRRAMDLGTGRTPSSSWSPGKPPLFASRQSGVVPKIVAVWTPGPVRCAVQSR
jgi:NMT1-like family